MKGAGSASSRPRYAAFYHVVSWSLGRTLHLLKTGPAQYRNQNVGLVSSGEGVDLEETYAQQRLTRDPTSGPVARGVTAHLSSLR